MSEILVALREAGIKDLEDLVKRVIGKAQDADEALDMFAPVAEPPAGASFSHRPPKIPFTVAGVTYDPADIKRFDGQPLHLVWQQLGEAPELIGFVGHELVRAITAYAQLRQLGLVCRARGRIRYVARRGGRRIPALSLLSLTPIAIPAAPRSPKWPAF